MKTSRRRDPGPGARPSRRQLVLGGLLAPVGWLAPGGLLLAGGCNQSQQKAESLNAATDNTTLGPGDVFRLEIVGEPDLPKEYQVAADGTVTLPYIQVVEVAGLEPHEVADRVRVRLMEDEILTDPSVVVSVLEYRSKSVTVLGQVQKPGSFAMSPGMTLLQVISMSGGVTALGNRGRVTLTRTRSDGKTKTVEINLDLITSGSDDDILLQPGDRIFVNERVF